MIYDKVNDKEKLQSQQYNRTQIQYKKKNNFAYKTNDLTYFLYNFCFYIIQHKKCSLNEISYIV